MNVLQYCIKFIRRIFNIRVYPTNKEKRKEKKKKKKKKETHIEGFFPFSELDQVFQPFNFYSSLA